MKATDKLKTLSGGQFISFRVAREDLRHWLQEPMPVILIVYDARADAVYWLYVQDSFESQPGFNLRKVPAHVTVHIPRSNIANQEAIRKFAAYRDTVLAQTKGVLHHD